jgi:hypothetical protein
MSFAPWPAQPGTASRAKHIPSIKVMRTREFVRFIIGFSVLQ